VLFEFNHTVEPSGRFISLTDSAEVKDCILFDNNIGSKERELKTNN
jgi:hypothetical protein